MNKAQILKDFRNKHVVVVAERERPSGKLMRTGSYIESAPSEVEQFISDVVDQVRIETAKEIGNKINDIPKGDCMYKANDLYMPYYPILLVINSFKGEPNL